jgi:hypothetical protein
MPITTHHSAIRHFITQMDIDMLDALLDDKYYQVFTKQQYLDKLENAFQQFKDWGDTELIAYEGRCSNCDPTKTGYTFVGNNSNNYITIIFKVREDRVYNFDNCSALNINRPDVVLKEQITIAPEI